MQKSPYTVVMTRSYTGRHVKQSSSLDYNPFPKPLPMILTLKQKQNKNLILTYKKIW